MAGRKGKRRSDFMPNELTVYDFADSSRPAACARMKKGVTYSTIKEVKKLSSGPGLESKMKEEEEELRWFEKDLDDFDIPIPPDNEDGEGEDDLAEEAPANTGRRCRVKRIQSSSAEGKQGMVYPVDLWYLLANHIAPEAVLKFSFLCKDAYETTRKCSFWRSLYKRYYTKEKELPTDLKTHAMERNHGLRARCIRALFFLDPPLAQRVQLKGPFETDPHSLVGYRCLLVWHQPWQGKWHFCFKLQRPSLRPPTTNMRPAYLEDVRNGYNNLFYNPEEGCCVLQVTSTHFASTSPHVMGQLLSAVHMTLSHNFHHQRLRLSFDSRRVRETSASAGHALECVLDPAVAVRIFHWWDPNYPFPT